MCLVEMVNDVFGGNGERCVWWKWGTMCLVEMVNDVFGGNGERCVWWKW